MSSISYQHNPPTPSVGSTENPITEHDDVSITASDDVDMTSISTATDPSIIEQDQNIDDKPTTSPKRSPPSSSRGPVQLLRRQQQSNSSQTPRQVSATGDARYPSPTHLDFASVKETVDPSLLEAFANPMNRQYLLQLESSLNTFVSQSKTDTFELPPTNSFFRCLAHKMADLYKLQHVADSGHVVLFRSQFARIPETRLSELSKSLRTSGSSASSTVASEDSSIPPASAPEFKQIMKRVPGKSARDAEDDAKSESSTSQVLTHEERQAMYEKTRARIFSDYVESQDGEKGSDDAESETSSTRREKSLHRSDSFQTRQQFTRESTSSSPYSSYAAALAGHQQQIPIQPPYQGYPPQQGYVGYYQPPQYPPTVYPYPPPMSSRGDPTSRGPSRPDSQSSPTTTRNDNPGFQPNPFAREFVPTGGSGSGSGVPPRQPKTSSTPTTTTTSRNPTPPTSTLQVKKTASFENNPSRPLTPTPIYTRSQSASSMRPQQQYPPPAYSYTPPQLLPFPPPMSITRQTEWGPPITTGTVRYVANGQPITPQILPYRAHPMIIPPMKPVYGYPSPVSQLSRNGVIPQDLDTSQELDPDGAGVNEQTRVEKSGDVTMEGNDDVVVEENISTEQSM